MTYEQLRILDTVVRLGSFKAASKSLYKSQPALSIAIKKLEEEFQIKIFNRDSYRPTLTANGKLFYEKAQLALLHMNSLQNFGEELALGVEPEVSISLDGVIPIDSLICEFRTFFAEYHQTNLSLSIDYVSGTLEKLLEKKIDIGFTPLMDIPEEFEAIEVFRISFIPVCSAEMFQTQKLSLKNLKQFPQVIVSDSAKAMSQDFGILKGVRRWNVSDFASKLKIIEQALGWGSMPDYYVSKQLQAKQLQEISIANIHREEAAVYMVRNKEKAMGPITKKLWQELQTKNIYSNPFND